MAFKTVVIKYIYNRIYIILFKKVISYKIKLYFMKL
jgi:hypothetical protein